MGEYGISQSIPRFEDARLLTGGGDFIDDDNAHGQLHGSMVRSPHAHAHLISVDTQAATSFPGVVAVLTGADFSADDIGDLGHGANPAGAEEWQQPAFVNRDGTEPFDEAQPPIIRDRVRHAGEIVAVVIAETDAAAHDAAGLVAVDYDTLPVVTDALAAIAPGAPAVWDECPRSEEHTSELQSLAYLVCRLVLEKKKKQTQQFYPV